MATADVKVHRDDAGNAVVSVSGEIDLAVGDDLLNTLHATIRGTGISTVTIDLSEVSFMDSTGVHVLLKAHATAQGSGVGLAVVSATGLVRRVLEITGVWELLGGVAPHSPDAQVAALPSVVISSHVAGVPAVGRPA